MKHLACSLTAFAALLLAFPCGAWTVSLDGEWLFSKDGGVFAPVEVHHYWAIAGPFDIAGDEATAKLPWKASGVYRRSFDVDAVSSDASLCIEFDGVMARAEVYVNGVRVGGWDYGYMGFSCDITAVAKVGGNDLEVRASTLDMRSRWYPGGGLYRSVRLVSRNSDSPLPGSVAIRAENVSASSATICVRWDTRRGRREKTFIVQSPILWSPQTPHLYNVEVGGETYRYGIRTAGFSPDGGFMLNGRRIQIKGANLHSDLGILGMAFHKGAARRQLELMKDMGVNAIRTAHNPPAPEFLDLCDELGLLVWDECFDKWDDTAGRRSDENLEEYVSRNLAAFVASGRNHPCVVCWSIGNEIAPATPSYPDGLTKERIDRFSALVRTIDPTRPVGLANCHPEWFSDKSIFDSLDVTGWNYQRAYKAFRDAHTNAVAVVETESAAALSSRESYGVDVPTHKSSYDCEKAEVSSWDTCAAPYGDIPDLEFERIRRDSFCAGDFVWTGIDYLGEPTPFDYTLGHLPRERRAHSSYFGCADLTLVPKDRFFLYRSNWNEQSHTLHIVSSGRTAFVYTDGDEAELFADSRSLGRRRKRECAECSLDFVRTPPPAHSFCDNPYYAICRRYRLMWFDVPEGCRELSAIAWKDGQEIARTTKPSPGAARRLEVKPETERDGLVFFDVAMVDENGTVVTSAEDDFTFTLSGPVRFLAAGNGAPNDYGGFCRYGRAKLYHGRALVIALRTGDGEISMLGNVVSSTLHSALPKRIIPNPLAK